MKLNLCIDANYIMQKSVFMLYKLRYLYTDLPVILEKDYNTLTKLFPFSKVYFISDSRGNWRKKFLEDYKGTRKKNENIDWNSVYDIFNKFKYEVNKKGNCESYQIDELEGDDIISYIVKKTNEMGHSNMIISNDSDLYQLLESDTVNGYMNFMYNFKFSDETLFLPKVYQLFLDSLEVNRNFDDLFNDSNDDNNVEFLEFIGGMIKNKKVTEIDSEKELFVKIIGHNKDSIRSIYMKGNRGIGKEGCAKIYDFYKETYPEIINFNSDEFKDRLIEIVKYYKRVKTNEMDENIRERLELNLKIVKLDKKSLPNNLYEKLEDIIEI